MGLTAKLAWWVKATAIVVTSGFFVEAFFATKSLLGWPGTGQLPPQFQLLWSRVVEPDPKVGERGAVYLVGRGSRRKQCAVRRAARVSPAVYTAACRPLDQGARRDHFRQAAGRHRRRHDGGGDRNRRPSPSTACRKACTPSPAPQDRNEPKRCAMLSTSNSAPWGCRYCRQSSRKKHDPVTARPGTAIRAAAGSRKKIRSIAKNHAAGCGPVKARNASSMVVVPAPATSGRAWCR